MRELFITELAGGAADGLWVLYTDNHADIIPRIGEYIRLHQAGIPEFWFLVKHISYENYSYQREYDPRVHIYVERVKGGPPFYRSSAPTAKKENTE